MSLSEKQWNNIKVPICDCGNNDRLSFIKDQEGKWCCYTYYMRILVPYMGTSLPYMGMYIPYGNAITLYGNIFPLQVNTFKFIKQFSIMTT